MHRVKFSPSILSQFGSPNGSPAAQVCIAPLSAGPSRLSSLQEVAPCAVIGAQLDPWRVGSVQGVGTVIQDLCGGQYVSQVKAAGAPQSDTTQPFTLLTLDILPDSVQTISGAISRFTEVNTLEGEPPASAWLSGSYKTAQRSRLRGACLKWWLKSQM